MAGRPKLNQLVQGIRERGGDDWFFAQVADGRSMSDIASEFDQSRYQLYAWMDLDKTGERRERYKQARRLSAEALEERGGDILDELAEPGKIFTSADVSLAKERARYRQWQAESRDPENYGSGPSVQVNVTAGSLHLDALRQRGSMGEPAKAEEIEAAEPEALPAEVVEDGAEDDVLEALR